MTAKFEAFYNKNRFRYIHENIVSSKLFKFYDHQFIPKTACFFSNDLDVYIDTSDGVNDDLQIQEYCGRILACIKQSGGKRFLFFKCAHSAKHSRDIEKLALENNGKVIPFFKWSFNNDFYSHTLPNLSRLRSSTASANYEYDIGLFADFSKKYLYPKPSVLNDKISWSDHNKFGIPGSSLDTGWYEIKSRPHILDKLQKSVYNIFADSQPYQDYIFASMKCRASINPPGIGEYTSRIMDQTAIGNLIILRKNSYDQGHSWKDYLTEIDFSQPTWEQELALILDNRSLWAEKGKHYFDTYWSSNSVFKYFIKNVEEAL